MAGASAEYHESLDVLKPETLDHHRAIVSIMEELEAIDWYDQRVDATNDASLAAILAHNRDEEKEHAAMLLEWLRRRDPKLDEHLRGYLFTQQSVIEREHELDARSANASTDTARAPGIGDGSLGIGSLRAEATR
ncbi:MAG TPA: ferritin-like domain-containing protein [Casimicrobiaceae bacterium]|nr:ferritin-like domain-containing protein [Casimicrobiaceae bacterium]